uniref:C-type lectin domain-containing protein n=1 Tax=Bothriechis nubestris TaxID=1766655 RepID=A0A6B2FD68_9SAUR
MGRFIFVSFGLLVVAVSLSGTEDGFECPSDWSTYRQYCYKFFQRKMNWPAAEEFCSEQAKGGHLVSIESSEEADFVAQLVAENIKKTNDYVWIGLKVENGGQQCSSKWSDGSSVSYENVVRPYSKMCLAMKEEAGFRTWHNVYCGNKHVFMCKFLRPR